MKKQTYKELRALLCALSTSVFAFGCSKTPPESTFPSTEKETKRVETITEVPTEPITSAIEETIETSVSQAVVTKDEMVLEYINDFSDAVDSCVDTVSDASKTGFITVVDFLFYNGTIGGVTFDELEDTTKEKVLEISNTAIIKIDAKFPNFRSTVSEKYEQASTYLIAKKDELVDLVKGKLGDEKVNQISKYYEKTKDKASDTYDKAKEKVKKWYEEFRDN